MLMPRQFSDHEQTDIERRLLEAGAAFFRTKGVRKTTIDELADAAGIGKGSFYKFFDTKELLYFEILERKNEEIRKPLLESKVGESANPKAALSKRLRSLLFSIHEEPLFRLIGDDAEFRAVVRRAPPERLRAHERLDQKFLDQMIERWRGPGARPKRDVLAARVSAAVLVALRRDFFGERLFPIAIDAAVESIVACLFGGRRR
ncbi:MAG: TetR/AcrR family transcriptional regulator [Pseudomonadota bacterium]